MKWVFLIAGLSIFFLTAIWSEHCRIKTCELPKPYTAVDVAALWKRA